ncbi:MAG: hypothetical protein K9K38_13140 [Rhodoferax sp.]|nr:hypothetical protein [Rhodoferax sp.]MCF8210324.1 hypothetical protein [Rhodoferax sp.]
MQWRQTLRHQTGQGLGRSHSLLRRHELGNRGVITLYLYGLAVGGNSVKYLAGVSGELCSAVTQMVMSFKAKKVIVHIDLVAKVSGQQGKVGSICIVQKMRLLDASAWTFGYMCRQQSVSSVKSCNMALQFRNAL